MGMVYKCKICAGTVTIQPKSRVAICDYCGTKQVMPLFTDESAKKLYDQGNVYLNNNEYDKAENIFQQLLSLAPDDGEIYWDLVLCKYGVTYVKDPKTEKYVPTCNRTYTGSIFNDDNYKKAVNYAAEEDVAIYKADAELIDQIQKGIVALSRKEKPFDIFISYKETDENGNRTKDSLEAQKLYDRLTELGYKVFFSRITLESKIGQEYEPYIYAALSSSKVMITVSSCKEYLEAPWVKNEWSRFLTLKSSDSSKMIIPVYFEMERGELPEEFAILPAQKLDEDDFEQELLRGIKKIIAIPITKAEKRKKINRLILIAIVVIAVISVLFIILKVRENKNKAEEEELAKKYESAMQLYANCDYEDAQTIFKELSDYENSSEMVTNCDYQPIYDKGMELYSAGQYPEASWTFLKILDYKDAADIKKDCEKKWRESLVTVTENDYYIDNNGSVGTMNSNSFEALEYDFDESGEIVGSHKVDSIDHGKIVSIKMNGELYLHEDGYVTNSAVKNHLSSDWENVIQITEIFNEASVALLADGSVIYGNYDETKLNNDEWLSELDSWENIIKLDYSVERDPNGYLFDAIIVGVDANGDVHVAAYYDDSAAMPYGYSGMNVYINHKGWNNVKDFVENLNNIKQIKTFSVINEYYTYSDRYVTNDYGKYYDEHGFNDYAYYDEWGIATDECGAFESEIIIVAMSSDGEIYTYSDGQSEISKGKKDIVDCSYENGMLLWLNNKGDLISAKDEILYLSNIIYLDKSSYINTNGNIYQGMEELNPSTGLAIHSYGDIGKKTSILEAWYEE